MSAVSYLSHEAASDLTDSNENTRVERLAVNGMCLTLDKRVILDDVSFSIAQGEIVGILGPNGCGKTSLLRCMTGILRPSRGTVWLNGKELNQQSRASRAALGVVFQDPSLDVQLTAQENLLLGAGLFGIRKNEARTRAAELLQFMELDERSKEPVKVFSGGMRRRLELARALIHRPDVLLLDEPSNGLDPFAFEKVWQRLFALRKLQGLTMLLTSHRADEAERCDRLVIMDRGHVVAVDTPDNLLSRVSGDVITIEAEEIDDLQEQLRAMGYHGARTNDGTMVSLEAEAGHELIPRLVEAFPAGRFRSIAMRRPTMADAFFKITGRSLADEEEVP